MSLPLKDFRCGVTVEIDNALSATARAFGVDKATVAREVLGEWAAKKFHEAKVHVALSRANGTNAASAGIASDDSDTDN